MPDQVESEADRWKKSALFYLEQSIRKGAEIREHVERFCRQQAELERTRSQLRRANAELAQLKATTPTT